MDDKDKPTPADDVIFPTELPKPPAFNKLLTQAELAQLIEGFFGPAQNPSDSECAGKREILELSAKANKHEYEICDYCSDMVRQSDGEDGISVCDNCGVVEGHTHWEGPEDE